MVMPQTVINAINTFLSQSELHSPKQLFFSVKKKVEITVAFCYRLRNDLYCVGWGVKLCSIQKLSINQSVYTIPPSLLVVHYINQQITVC